MSVLVRIQTLEDKLQECQSRLNTEEKRRKILENWILQNFNFDIQFELEHCNEDMKIVKSSIQTRREKKLQIQTQSSEIQDIDDDVDPNYLPSSPDQEQQNFQNTGSNKKIKRSRKRRRPGEPKRSSGGREKDEVWDHYRTIPQTKDGTPAIIVVCNRCDKKVSGKAFRLKGHLAKCTGPIENERRYSNNNNNNTSKINCDVITLPVPIVVWENEDTTAANPNNNVHTSDQNRDMQIVTTDSNSTCSGSSTSTTLLNQNQNIQQLGHTNVTGNSYEHYHHHPTTGQNQNTDVVQTHYMESSSSSRPS